MLPRRESLYHRRQWAWHSCPSPGTVHSSWSEQPFPSKTGGYGGEVGGGRASDRLGAPQNHVSRRHVKALAGVVSVPAVQVATSRLLQGVEGVQGVGVLGGVEIEPELVRVLTPGVHHHRHIGCCQSLLAVLLPRLRQGRTWRLHFFA